MNKDCSHCCRAVQDGPRICVKDWKCNVFLMQAVKRRCNDLLTVFLSLIGGSTVRRLSAIFLSSGSRSCAASTTAIPSFSLNIDEVLMP